METSITSRICGSGSARAQHRIAPLLIVFFGLSCSNATPQQQHGQSQPDSQIAQPAGQAAAFPAAIGYGSSAKGGQGGRIIAVTNLHDNGPGSYRECVEADGPRVCVFRVDGVIRFTGLPPIIRNPYITIAGQTAPGAGITLSHAGGMNGRTPLVIKGTHDVIVRHVRVRLDRAGGDRRAEDAITIENSRNVVIDHVSASGARDENINGHGDNDRITISNSIFSYGVPRHDKCALLSSDPPGPQNVSFIANICAHSGDRNPDANFPQGSCVEVINNQLYNAQSEFAEVWESEGGTPISIVGNSFIAGPDTRPFSVGIENDRTGSIARAQIYEAGNRFIGSFVHISARATQTRVAAPPCKLTIDPLPAETAYETVLGRAGAYPRDAIDGQVVAEIRDRSGQIGYLPRNLAQANGADPYGDADEDGMDDLWERKSGADPVRFDAWEDPDGDGISNLEAFLAFREQQLRP